MKIVERIKILGSHFPQAEFACNIMAHDSTGFPSTLKGIDFVKKFIKKYKTITDNKRCEEFFEEEDMKIVYLERENLN